MKTGRYCPLILGDKTKTSVPTMRALRHLWPGKIKVHPAIRSQAHVARSKIEVLRLVKKIKA